MVMATLDRSKQHKGTIFFIVDREWRVFLWVRRNLKWESCSNTTEVILDDVRVHKKWRLGEEGEGFK